MSMLKNQIETDLGIGLLGKEGTGESYTSIKLSPYKQKGMFESYGYVNVFYVLEDGNEKEIYGSYKVDMDSPLFKKIEEEKLLKEKQQKEEKLLKEKQLEEEKISLRKLLSKYQNSPLIEMMLEKIVREQKTSRFPKWQLNQIQDLKAVFSKFQYGKIWEIKLKIIFSEFTEVEKKLNNQIVRDGFVITGNIYPSDLGITKKNLKQMGGKLNIEF